MRFRLALAGFLFALPIAVQAETTPHLVPLEGLASVTALEKSDTGKAALAANLRVTGAIQTGAANQVTLLPWPEQQQQALKDATITATNAYQLADGLGTRLGGIYQAATREDEHGVAKFTNISPAIARLIGYAVATSHADSSAGKFFFANATTDGKTPAPPALKALITGIGGKPDMFGRAYDLPAGTLNGNPYGNARPFQTEPRLTIIAGRDFDGVPTTNVTYLRGPFQDLTTSPSYPSGHTTYGYTEALVLALLVPERYPQMVIRAAEYGNSRIILGAHYAMDVLGGRTLALYDLAQLLANKPGYVGVPREKFHIDDFRKALAEAREDMTRALSAGCGAAIPVCAGQDDSRFKDPAKNKSFYDSTQTYGLGEAFPDKADRKEDVAKLAPEAGYLLTAAFPHLTLDQANAILTETEGPGGGFLDNGTAFGVYSRLDLYAASLKAAATAPSPHLTSP